MDITAVTVVSVLVLGGLYFFVKGRREGGPRLRKKRNFSKTSPNATAMSGQFSADQWGEFEGARGGL